MTIHLERDGHLARVTIDRPDRMNAIDAEAESQLQAIWSEIENDPGVRCVVLTGAGERAFCTGADMKAGSGSSGLDYWASARPGGFGGIAFRHTLDVPVIARVNGYALGGGMEMVLGCDIVIASETAQFGLPEGRVGRLPVDGGMVLLQRKVPHNLAMGMMLTGRRFPAGEMARWGLVNEVAPAAELDAAVDRWAAEVLANAPLSNRAMKQVVQRTGHLAQSEALALKLPALVAALGSADSQEGVRAFQEKRAPVWQGR